jgi:hypothetical protein
MYRRVLHRMRNMTWQCNIDVESCYCVKRRRSEECLRAVQTKEKTWERVLSPHRPIDVFPPL